jgi:very-short-patch-repair endonuclease
MQLAIMLSIFAPRKKLIIELDGSQHLEQTEYDAQRTEFLQSKGYRVVRFWNNDVSNNMDAVLNVILESLTE